MRYLNTKFTEKNLKKLGIEEEAISVIMHCECGEINDAHIIELSKLRNWEIQEEIVNFFKIDKDGNEVEIDNWFYCNLNKLCKTFGFERSELAYWYARAISEGGYSIAYALESNEDVVLILE